MQVLTLGGDGNLGWPMALCLADEVIVEPLGDMMEYQDKIGTRKIMPVSVGKIVCARFENPEP